MSGCARRHGGPRHHGRRRAGCPRAENIRAAGEIRNNSMTMAVQIARLYHSAEDFSCPAGEDRHQWQSIYLADIADVEVGPERRQRLSAQWPREPLG